MALHLHITGRVQGVGYRAALLDQAVGLGLAGWVRNRRDGSVEAVVCGRAEAISAIVAWAHIGPAAARVTAVTATEIDGAFDKFEFMPTA